MLRTFAVATTALVLGCAHHQRPPVAPASGTEAATTPRPVATLNEGGEDPNVARLVIGDRIREACGIDDSAAFFDYDSDHVAKGTERVLQQVAGCFVDGPLAGRSMQLVGHADPRGSDEYNLVLGNRRAENVKRSLGRFGLGPNQAATSSRGEMDATGTDEDSWAADRNVELLLIE